MATLLARGQITIAAIKDGKNGADAVSVLVENAPLVFDTNDDGIVSPDISKLAKVKIMRGNRNVSDECSDVYSRDDMCVNCKCGARQENGYIGVSILSDNITKNDVIVNGVIQGKVSATSGYAVAQVAYDGVTYFVQVPFSVNVAKFTGVVAFNNKQYESKFTLIAKRLDNTPTNNDLTKAEARITQTAREISLSVSEKSIGRRNLLIGSAFQRDDNNRVISNDAKIEMNSGYQGTNCIHVNDTTEAGSPHYVGAYWDGSQNGRSIKIKKGKKYTMSCFYKTNDINAKFTLEAIYTNKQENATRLGQATYSSSNFFTVKKVNEWELFTVVVDTADAKSDYIAFNFWEACNVSVGQIEAWICRPMVEEGDTYNGWTLSTEDYDYVGGNMLDNTRTLDKSGTLYDVNGTLTPAGFGESTSIYKSFNYVLKGTVSSFSQLPSSGNVYGDTYYVSNTETCYRYNGSEFESVGNDYYYNILHWGKIESGAFVPFGLEANKDYVFSFMAKGTGKLSAYFYNPDTNVFVEGSLGVTENNVNGHAKFQLTSDWKKYWVHWRPSDSSHKFVLLRLNRTIQGSADDAPITNCYIAQPKLEAGAVVTEYTERKSDLVDKASLKKAGIEIKSDEVILYGDKIRVDNNGQTAAMFIGGKLNAAFIDADKIEVKHLWAKSNDGASKVGYFGNTEESACKLSDGTLAPLFIGGDTAAKSPFYVTSNGAMHATSGYIGGFSIINDGIICSAGGNEMRINTSYIKFHNEQHGITNIVGANWGYGIDYTAQQIIVKYDHPTKLTYMGSQATVNQMNVGLYVSASGTKHRLSRDSWQTNSQTPCGNHAIFCDKGDFAGFRPCYRKITASQTLTKYDVFLEVNETWKQHNDVTGKDTEVSIGSVTITLPKDPEIGQMYWILRATKYNYTLKTTDGTLIDYPGGKGTSVTLTTNRELVCVIFKGEYWSLIWRIGVV